MIAIGDDQTLHLLEFLERKELEREIQRLQETLKTSIVEGSTPPLDSIKREIALYFEGKLPQFNTPVTLAGTAFQTAVWKELLKIPYGKTKSYLELAVALKKPTAARAVAQANAANQLALIVPCHRVINATGELGGYAAGVGRKSRLLNHEKAIT